MATATAFDIEALRRALEDRDADLLISLYADDAEITEVDKDHPPRNPRTLRGRSEIEQHFRDVCGRAMSHKLERPVIDGSRLAYTEECLYDDGTTVLTIATADFNDDRKIVRQVAVTAWDG